jgi:hypothetical protein
MSGSRFPRRLACCAAVLVGLLATGCAGRSDALGAGDKINWCAAYFIRDGFWEPKPDSRSEVLQYAEASLRVIDRVDVRREIRTVDELKLPNGKYPKPSPEAMADLKALRPFFLHLRDQVKALPSDGAAVRAATVELAADPAYAQAEQKVTDYFSATCAR